MKHSFHVSIEKGLLIREIRRLGLRAVLRVPDGVTEGDMIGRIERDPRQHFVCDPTCDRQTPEGMCAGHEIPPGRAAEAWRRLEDVMGPSGPAEDGQSEP